MHHALVRPVMIAAAVILLVPALAWAAEPDLARARDAYDRGVRAHAAGDEGAAAKAFAEADALAPTTASLEAALEAAMRADDVALGAELLERSQARPDRDTALTKTIENARTRFANRAGTVRLDCHGSVKCLLAIDGRAADTSKTVYVAAGPHTIVVQQGPVRFEKLVEVVANQTTAVSAGDPVVLSPAPVMPTVEPAITRPPPPKGISPVYFWIGAGLTVIAGGFATWSGLSAVSDHDDFVRRGCAPGASGPKPGDCESLSDSGASATLRTNLLVGATALLAINTAVLGAIFVRWSPAPAGAVGGTLGIGGAL